MNRPEAYAEISLEPNNIWNLSPAGTAHPLRYWAHLRSENDRRREPEFWTLFVELEAPPRAEQTIYSAKVFFMAPDAPHHLLQPGWNFELSVGDIIKARGVVKDLENQPHLRQKTNL
jgi:hypothetical protein